MTAIVLVILLLLFGIQYVNQSLTFGSLDLRDTQLAQMGI